MKLLLLALAASFTLCGPTFACDLEDARQNAGVGQVAKRSNKTHEDLSILAAEKSGDEKAMYLAGCGCSGRSQGEEGKEGKKDDNKTG